MNMRKFLVDHFDTIEWTVSALVGMFMVVVALLALVKYI